MAQQDKPRGVWSSRQCLLAAGLVLIFDLISKFVIQQFVETMSDETPWYPYGGIGVFRDFLGIEFTIIHATNKGAAWGMFARWQDTLLYARIVLVVSLTAYLLFYLKQASMRMPLSLVLAGAFGNILDYFFYGHVVDMFHFVLWGYDYPVFNVADSAICVGIFWILLLSFFEDGASTKVEEEKAPPRRVIR